MIKVIHTTPYVAESGNGVLEYVYQVANVLRGEVDFEFAHFSTDVSSGVRLEEVDGFVVRSFPMTSYKGFSLPKEFRDWVATLDKDTTVFHLHSVFYPPNFVKAKILNDLGFAFIHTPHDSYSPESMIKNRMLKEIYMVLFERQLLAKATVVHALTPLGEGYIRRYTSNPTVEMVTNFVPVVDHQVEVIKKQRKISFLGRYDFHQKGIDLMLETLGRFKHEQGQSVPFTLIGKYDQESKNRLETLMKKEDITQEEVHMTGRVSAEDKTRLLSESKFYFQLSRFEGFGLAIAEALAVGTPVIITDKVPISQIIDDHGAGFVVSSVAEATQALLEGMRLSNSAYQAMCQRAKRCYQEAFHPSIIGPQLKKMYHKALAMKSDESILSKTSS